jgi:hypothetical protein
MTYEEQIKQLIENILLNKKLPEIEELPENYELTGNEVMYIVADGKDYRIKNSRIVAAFAQALSEHQELVGSETELGHFKLGANFTVDEDEKLQLDISSELQTINNALDDKADLGNDGKVPLEQLPDLGSIAADQLSGVEIPQLIKKTSSNNPRNFNDNEASTNSSSYVKLKTIKFTKGLLGQQKFTFLLRSADGVNSAQARIRKNGVNLGTERITTSETDVLYTETITTDWDKDDTCELWAAAFQGISTAIVSNFRVYYDDAPTVAVPSENL